MTLEYVSEENHHKISQQPIENAEAQKAKIFWVVAFHMQKFSGQSARIHVSRHIKKRVNVSCGISEMYVFISLDTKSEQLSLL